MLRHVARSLLPAGALVAAVVAGVGSEEPTVSPVVVTVYSDYV